MPHRGYKIPGCIARIFLIPLALLLSACSDADHKQDGKIVIKYWEKWNGPEADAMRAVVNDYNASQEKVYVDFSTVSQMDRRLMLAIAGGVPPNVAGFMGNRCPSTPRITR